MTGVPHLGFALAGLVAGALHSRQIHLRHKDVSLQTVHCVTRVPILVVVVTAALVSAVWILSADATLFWKMPIWFDANSNRVLWLPILFAVAYIMTLGSSLAWRERHAKRVTLTAASVTLLAGLLALQFQLNSTPRLDVAGKRSSKGYHLQTTGCTCAPASGANIAMWFGLGVSEAQMAMLMGTTVEGTTAGQVILGMRKIGLSGMKVTQVDPQQIAPPAMLFVDHEATGPESHAVALISNTQNRVHIVDPLIGELRINAAELKKIWHGKAVEFKMAEQPPAAYRR